MEEVMVSINCITYNHQDYIADAIEGFLMQKTNFNFEILIHDDASTDRTPDIIREYELKYPDLIRPIYQKENQYSKGIDVLDLNSKRAKGKYIALCEGDDYWTDPFKLQRQVDYMEKNPKCTLCAHTVEKVSVDKMHIGFERPYQKNVKCHTTDLILGGGYFVATASLLFPRRLAENLPEFYFSAPVSDYPLQIFLASKGYVYYIDDVMGAYRVGVQAGWSQRQITGNGKRNVQLQNVSKFLDMLAKFDVFTGYRYSNTIEKKKIYYEFKKSLLKRDVRSIISNEFFKRINLRDKISVFIKMFFPSYNQKIFKRYIDELLNSL